MEIAGADGINFHINPGQSRELGRGNGIHSSDKTISRRQISFSLPQLTHNPETRLQFEVLGRNPIYVSRNDEVKVFRRFESGEMESGDMFCLSAKDPIWYSLKGFPTCGESVRQNDLKSEFSGDFGGDFAIKGVDDLRQGDVDISCIDPVTEFGFLVIGHEFDLYPKKMLRDIKNWDWFLEEVGRGGDVDNGDDDEMKKKGKRKGGKKRKKGAENEDEDWSGESEDDKVLINNPKNFTRPKYTTRSKDRVKPGKATTGSSSGKQTPNLDDEDEDDETLGGFIVDDENLDEDEDTHDEAEEEEEEEEEFVDEDDE